MCPLQMAHLGTNQKSLHVRLSAKDAASLRKLAKANSVSVSTMIRTLVHRAKVAATQVLA